MKKKISKRNSKKITKKILNSKKKKISKRNFGAIHFISRKKIIDKITVHVIYVLKMDFTPDEDFSDLFETFFDNFNNNCDLPIDDNVNMQVLQSKHNKKHFNVNISINKIPFQDNQTIFNSVPQQIIVTKNNFDFKFNLIEFNIEEHVKYEDQIIY